MQQKQLTQKERYHIWASLKRGVTQKEIAHTIGVHPSTICREIQRNKDSVTEEYHYAFAQTKSQRRQQAKEKYTVFTTITVKMSLFMATVKSPKKPVLFLITKKS